MQIGIQMHSQYKSFKADFAANTTTNLIVMTGSNGAGKSQFLQLLTQRGFLNLAAPQATTTVIVDDKPVDRRQILGIFNWDMPGTPTATAADPYNFSSQLHSIIVNAMGASQPIDENTYTPEQIASLEKMILDFRAEGFNNSTRIPSIDEVIDRLPDRFSSLGAQIVNERIASIVVDWHISALETPSEPTLGEDPVRIFNQLCEEFGLEFHLPAWISLRRPYAALLINADGDSVQWNELSSGEQVIFRIICWLFYYRTKNNFYPKVLLLDEPDAHLTPQMIRRFLHSLRETVHEKLGIAIIMTTHSPNTVALVDEAALYRLSRSPGGARDLVKVNRQQAVTELSEGLLFVQEDTRLVFVEGKTDVPFYQRIYQSMASALEIDSIPSLKFFAASHGQEDRGGVTKVREVVARFSETHIERLVCGICDGDAGNVSQKNLWVLDRYSIENYIYDPFLVACHLLIGGKQAYLQSLNGLQTGSWMTLVDNVHLRQSAVSEICEEWATLLAPGIAGAEMSGTKEVTWRVGSDSQPVAYSIPGWMTRMRGKDLTRLGVHNKSSSLKNVVNLEGQYVAMETLRAVPEDIHRILLDIQKPVPGSTDRED